MTFLSSVLIIHDNTIAILMVHVCRCNGLMAIEVVTATIVACDRGNTNLGLRIISGVASGHAGHAEHDQKFPPK